MTLTTLYAFIDIHFSLISNWWREFPLDNGISKNPLLVPYREKILWIKRLNINCHNMIVVNNSIYVMGDTPTFRAYLAKYDDNGNLIWKKSWRYPTSDWDINMAGVNLNNSIFVFGQTAESPLPYHNMNRIFIRSYDYNGTELINQTLMVTDKNIIYPYQSVHNAILLNNYIYISGSILEDGHGPPIYGYLAKLNEKGEMLWNRTWLIPNSPHPYVTVTTLNGNLYVQGDIQEKNRGSLFSFRLFDESGHLLWVKNWTFGGGSIGKITAYDGFLYIAGGDFNKNQSSQDALLVKLDPSGNIVWHRFIGWPNAVESFGDIYFTKKWIYASGGGGNITDGFSLVKYDFNGTLKSYIRFLGYPYAGLSIDGTNDFIYQILENGPHYLAKIVDASAAPRNLTATPGNRTVSLRWDPPEDHGLSSITNYKIYRSVNNKNTTYYTTIGNITEYVDSNLINGNTYYYRVAAVNSEGEGYMSEVVSAKPASIPYPPYNLTATLSKRNVALRWNEPVDIGDVSLDRYNIYRGTSPSKKVLIASTLPSQLTYLDVGTDGGTKYYYQVTAVNSLGESNRSGEVSITMPKTEPGAPRNLTAMPGNKQVFLEWEPPSSTGGEPIMNYQVYRGTSYGKETELATIGNVTSYLDINVTNGIVYYYQVAAINAIGTGLRCFPVSAIPSAPIPHVVSTIPINQSTNVPLNTSIIITFSQSMNHTDTESAISASPLVKGSFFWDGTSKILTWKPEENLQPNTRYLITISKEARSQDGIQMQSSYLFTFTTGENPPVPPVILGTEPTNFETGVPTSTHIRISFSEEMDHVSTEQAITASPAIDGYFSWDASSRNVTWKPKTNLQENTKYTISITREARSIHGITMEKDYVFVFTTRDETSPFVVSTYPVNGATDWDPNSKITIVFSEAMDRNATTEAVSISPGIITTREWNTNGTILTLTALLDEGKTYTVTITTDARDLSGKSIPYDYSFSFKTRAKIAQTDESIRVPVFIASVVIIDTVILILLVYRKRGVRRQSNPHVKEKKMARHPDPAE